MTEISKLLLPAIVGGILAILYAIPSNRPDVTLYRFGGVIQLNGYDLQPKDGTLDEARLWTASRFGPVSLTLDKESLYFKALQDTYSRNNSVRD